MTAGFAFAADSNVSADQIVNALRAKSPTRGLSAAPQADPAGESQGDQLRRTGARQEDPIASLNEREQIAEIASAKPKIDLEIRSITIRPRSARPRCLRCRNWARRSRIRISRFRHSWWARSHMRSALKNITRALRAPRRFDQALPHRQIRHPPVPIWYGRLRQEQAEGSERADRRDQTAAFRSSTWTARPRRIDSCACRPPAAAGGFENGCNDWSKSAIADWTIILPSTPVEHDP